MSSPSRGMFVPQSPGWGGGRGSLGQGGGRGSLGQGGGRGSLSPALGMVGHTLSASLPGGMWVPALSPEPFCVLPSVSPAHSEGCHLHGRAGDAGSCGLPLLPAARGRVCGEAWAAAALSIPGEPSGKSPCPCERWWQDLLARRQSQAQVNHCPGSREKAAGSLPPAPPWQTGGKEEEWRGRGEEVSRGDRRGERGSPGQGWGSPSLRKGSGGRCWGAAAGVGGERQRCRKHRRDKLEEQGRARALGFGPKLRSVFEKCGGNSAQVNAELILNKGFRHLV